MNLRNLNPRQKKILLGVIAGGGLALIALLGRGRSAGTTAADSGAIATPSYGSAGTFADNGAQAAGLSSDVTYALGDVATALDQLPDLVATSTAGAISDSLTQVPTGPSTDDWAAAFDTAFAPYAAAFTQAGAQNTTAVKSATSAVKTAAVPAPTTAQAKAAAGANVSFQTSGERAGLLFKTVTKDGKVYRFYESAAGKKDYGETKGSKIYVRPASK